MAIEQFELPEIGEETADSELVSWLIGRSELARPSGKTIPSRKSRRTEYTSTISRYSAELSVSYRQIEAKSVRWTPCSSCSPSQRTLPRVTSKLNRVPATESMSRLPGRHCSTQVSERLCQRPGKRVV